jgi:hypothetical protein
MHAKKGPPAVRLILRSRVAGMTKALHLHEFMWRTAVFGAVFIVPRGDAAAPRRG